MAFDIVLIEPEIPNNTGNIGRLALATGFTFTSRKTVWL